MPRKTVLLDGQKTDCNNRNRPEDDAGQATIMGVITLFEQAMATKEDLKKQYTECKDISPERRAVIEKCLDDEAWKDYEVM
ncbi:hypothetical protein Tco_1293242 [Tanacetum coccineum]